VFEINPLGTQSDGLIVEEQRDTNGGGRLDHMGVDLEKKRLFVAAVTNNTLEVVDLAGGKVIKSLAGFFHPFGLPFERNQIPRFVGNVSSWKKWTELLESRGGAQEQRVPTRLPRGTTCRTI
jgi:hypothetical protein